MKKRFVIMLLLCLHIATRGQTIATLDSLGLPHPTEARAVRYWIDDDAGSVITETLTNGSRTVDVVTLADGLHTLHYQVVDDADAVGPTYSSLFMKISATSLLSAVGSLRYWFDDDAATLTTIGQLSGTFFIDASALLQGLHTLHCQVLNTEGNVNYVRSELFMKTGSMGTADEPVMASKLLYWFDDETQIQQTDLSGGTQMIDASDLLDGLHTLHYQVLCNNGTMTPVTSALFMRANMDAADTYAKNLRYWFDDVPSGAKTIPVADGSQALDVSSLTTGLHTLCYQLIDNQGNVTTPVTALFMKTFDKVVEGGKNIITQYRYWVNNVTDNVTIVDLQGGANPYSLISLLPVQRQPIRSYSFDFRIEEGQPVIYAKNEIHIRFFDATGYFVDTNRQYLDEGVRQVISDITLMEPNSQHAFERPEENGIKWFSFTAEPGDTVAFRSSQTTSLQVFSPSGEEIFSTSGSESVQYGGCHTWESGTCYVAVHDVTGSRQSMTLDFMHMDKYDVVDQDVRIVGNGGCSTITFKGNGFKDLYAVDLYNATGDSIHHVDVGYISDAETAVTFDFSGAELGHYNAIFHFADEDKRFNNVITVEEARDIELETTGTYTPFFLYGRPTNYTIKITNKGNMTAYDVPIYIFIQNKNENGISSIKLDGLNLESYAAAISIDGISEKGQGNSFESK